MKTMMHDNQAFSKARIIGMSAILFLLLAHSGCRRDDPSSPAPAAAAKVKTQRIEPASESSLELVAGTVRPGRRATIEAKVSGVLDRILVTEGQVVKEGELLCELDVRELKARLDQAMAADEEARRELRRFTALLQQKASTQSEFDSVQTKARIAAARLTEAQTMLGYARVVAPFNGIITRKHADVGDLAAPGRALFEIEDPSALRLEANLPEALLPEVKPGQSFAVTLPAVPQPLPGVVVEIAPGADANTRTYLVKFALPLQDKVRSGQFGRVAIPGRPEVTIKVPAAALIRRGQLEFIYIVDQGRAWLRLVRSGRQLGEDVEILAGVAAGENMVIENAASLSDGLPVEVQP